MAYVWAKIAKSRRKTRPSHREHSSGLAAKSSQARHSEVYCIQSESNACLPALPSFSASRPWSIWSWNAKSSLHEVYCLPRSSVENIGLIYFYCLLNLDRTQFPYIFRTAVSPHLTFNRITLCLFNIRPLVLYNTYIRINVSHCLS